MDEVILTSTNNLFVRSSNKKKNTIYQMENEHEQLPAFVAWYYNEGDKNIFENMRACAWNLRQTTFIRKYQYLLIIIVITNA